MVSSKKEYHARKFSLGKENYKITPGHEKNGFRYVPITDDGLKRGKILLPKAPLTYLDTPNLLKEIREFIHKYCDLSETFLSFSSWYVLLSWVYDKFNTVPYLHRTGDTGTGKTRFLDAVGGLCYKPCFVSGAITTAPVFRQIEQWKGTLILDEADFRVSDEKADIVKILNTGFQKSGTVMRCHPMTHKIQYFDTFCPKLIATRHGFYDSALESRCLPEISFVTKRTDIPRDLPQNFFKERETLRGRLLSWRMTNWFRIDSDAGLDIDMGRLEPRLQQATISFVSLFAKDPVALESFRTFLANHQQNLIEDRGATLDGEIVNALAELLAEGSTFINSKDIISKMELKGYDKLTPQKVGKRLKDLNIKTKQIRHGKEVKKAVVIEDGLMIIFKRYVSDDELLNKAVSSVSSVSAVLGTGQQTLKSEKSTQNQNSPVLHTINTNDTKDTEKIHYDLHHICHICGKTPCRFDEKYRPICQSCDTDFVVEEEIV